LLRRQGLYSSLLTTWREKRAAAIEQAALELQKRERKADPRWPRRGGWSSSRGKTTAYVANSPWEKPICSI